jgi:4-hydroxy-2-oxoheptanedioate aldolase
VKSLDDTVIALMIEKASAVESLEAILSVKGIDMVQFGPADYSMSIGIPGQFKHPKVKEAERYVIETSLKMGKHPRAEIGHPDQAKEYLDMGVKHFCIGTDVGILYDWFKRNGKEMGSLIGRSPSDEPLRDFRGEGGGGYRGGA